MSLDWKKFYAHVTNPYHAPGPFYSGPGHHGVDFAAYPHQPVPAYFSGRLVENGSSQFLGNWSVYLRDDNMYVGYAHLLVGTRNDVGKRVRPGDPVGEAAGPGDFHGSSWTGSHCHTTLSHEVHGIYDGNTIDPAPGIAARVRGDANPKRPHAATGRKYTLVRAGEGGIAVAERVHVSFAHLQTLNPKVKDWSGLVVKQRLRYQ